MFPETLGEVDAGILAKERGGEGGATRSDMS